MPTSSRIDPTPIRLDTQVTEARQTPDDSFGTRLQNGASATANVVANGAAIAAPFVPGGAIVSAAVSGVGGMTSSASSGQMGMVGPSYGVGSYGAGGGGTTLPAVPIGSASPAVPVTGVSVPSATGVPVSSSDPTAGFGGVLQQEQAANMQYLMLQNQMQQENQQYSTLSNVLKVRHDTAKNSISNIH